MQCRYWELTAPLLLGCWNFVQHIILFKRLGNFLSMKILCKRRTRVSRVKMIFSVLYALVHFCTLLWTNWKSCHSQSPPTKEDALACLAKPRNIKQNRFISSLLFQSWCFKKKVQWKMRTNPLYFQKKKVRIYIDSRVWWCRSYYCFVNFQPSLVERIKNNKRIMFECYEGVLWSEGRLWGNWACVPCPLFLCALPLFAKQANILCTRKKTKMG